MDKESHEKSMVEKALEILDSQYRENHHFNDYFNGEEALSIPSPQQDVADYLYEKSRALFWLDRDAYFDEKEAWDNQTIQERHKDAMDLLKSTSQVGPFRQLVDAVGRKRVIPFVGAGLSVPMKMPKWKDALDKISSKLPDLNFENFESQMNGFSYLDAAQVLVDHDLHVTYNFIRTTYKVEEIKGVVLLLPQIASGCIVTTNFDDAIEEVFKRESILLDGYMHGTQDHNFFQRLVKGERCILKLHGDAENSHTYIFTRNQYTEAYGETFDFCKPLPKALRQIYVSNSLLFLGCSLEQDMTLELFKKVVETTQFEIPNHYAILPEPRDSFMKRRKESLLFSLNIQPIWYKNSDTEHQYVEKLLSLLIDVVNHKISLNS